STCTGSSPGRSTPTTTTFADTPSSGAAVRVVVIPPGIRRSLRIALRRVLLCLLPAERGDVEVVPRAPHLLVTAVVDEVRAEDPTVVADERVVAVPLVHVEVLVEIVGDGEPGDALPAVALLEPLDVGLRSARRERERRVPRVQMSRVGDLVGQ